MGHEATDGESDELHTDSADVQLVLPVSEELVYESEQNAGDYAE